MDSIQLLILITTALFLMKFLKDSLGFLWLFQTKEYRFDRMESHIKDHFFPIFSVFAAFFGTLIFLGAFFSETAEFIFVFLVLLTGLLAPVYFLCSLIKTIFEILKRAFKRPKRTTKILLILTVYIVLYSAFVFFISKKISNSFTIVFSLDFFILFSFYLLLLNALIPIFLLFAIAIVTPIANRKKRKIVRSARKKMLEMKKVKTIGITGSFGKTSTKEFLFAILSEKYKVVKTEGNNNTLMGVANTILNKVDDNFDFFICEMGAYKIGEIEEISSIAEPFAGIITGINEQHLDLFGSIENTKRGKFELIQSLPEDGFAVINKNALEMKPEIYYKVKDVTSFSKDIAKNIEVHPEYAKFEYKDIPFKIQVLGGHYIKNILSAIVAAEKLGMSLREIQAAVSKIDMKSIYFMHKTQGPHGSVFIDDSYSANPDGVIAALGYMREAYPKKTRILVFPGIIELGKDSEKIHKRLWNETDNICDLAYIMQKRNKEISRNQKKCHFIFGKNFDRIKTDLEKRLNKDTVVLFESRAAGVVMKKILDNNKSK
ncbi:MAG: UDP-N-acetylmuramoyl-tripeptide--D-alanyl-D-alanine ligase [Candidatus Pacebacteria bacterium]|nr:UDP-N-acetylmuramoyl-tripeptide--D-alanyl-D-alanine ligase [Candidatus Paceibacterota bacterium]